VFLKFVAPVFVELEFDCGPCFLEFMAPVFLKAFSAAGRRWKMAGAMLNRSALALATDVQAKATRSICDDFQEPWSTIVL
jgi:hypothetical protein